jgi:hypothetical protein
MDKVNQHPIDQQPRREALYRNAGAHPDEIMPGYERCGLLSTHCQLYEKIEQFDVNKPK